MRLRAGIDQPNPVGTPVDQHLGGSVGSIVEFGCCCQHASASFLADVGVLGSVEHIRDGGARDACTGGHVAAGDFSHIVRLN